MAINTKRQGYVIMKVDELYKHPKMVDIVLFLIAVKKLESGDLAAKVRYFNVQGGGDPVDMGFQDSITIKMKDIDNWKLYTP
jgi:hypothetical protein